MGREGRERVKGMGWNGKDQNGRDGRLCSSKIPQQKPWLAIVSSSSSDLDVIGRDVVAYRTQSVASPHLLNYD